VLNKRRGVVSSAATGNGSSSSYPAYNQQPQKYSSGNSGSYHTPADHYNNDFGYAKFDNAGFSSAPQFNSGLGVTSAKKKRYSSGGFTDGNGSGNGYQQQQQVQSRDQRRLSRSSQQDDRQQQQQQQPRKAPRSAVKQAPHKQLAKQKQRRLRNGQA
jgi:hypothetical protein